jgi:hypothetical protein
VFLAVFSIFYVHAKKWQSTDAGIQSHVLKAVAAFVGSLSNEALRLAPVKVRSLQFGLIYCAFLAVLSSNQQFHSIYYIPKCICGIFFPNIMYKREHTILTKTIC